MTGRHILARVIMPKTTGGYAGTLPLWGFAYQLEIARHPEGVLVTAYDGPPTDGYRIPAIDGEAT